MKFTEWLNENDINEAAGNLKGLPKNIIKHIVNGYDSGLGGENSEFKLFKSNAKQSDLTAATKLVGGFVKSGDRGSRSYSKAELEARANKDSHAGVLVKINGEWAFYAAFQDYSNKYILLNADGYVRKEDEKLTNSRRSKFGGSVASVTRAELMATELSEFINFKDDTVDIYLVTTDVERELKRQERAAERNNVSKVSPERKKALIEFLKKKSNGIIVNLNDDIKESTDKLNEYISASINRAITGQEKDITGDFKKITDELVLKLNRINSLGYQIAGIVKDGYIKDTRWSSGPEDSHHYQMFKNLVDAYEKEMK